ncbi:MAG: TIGR00725 family protein [Thermoleophilaceae bacterium]
MARRARGRDGGARRRAASAATERRLSADGTYVAVVGRGDASPYELHAAHEIGSRLAELGALVVCGGLGGVMEAACRGAKESSGTTLGLLPGTDRRAANPHVDVAVPTGLGEARNALVVRAADGVIAVGGAYGTLSEIALALKAGKPVVALSSWEIDGVVAASSPADAVDKVLYPLA